MSNKIDLLRMEGIAYSVQPNEIKDLLYSCMVREYHVHYYHTWFHNMKYVITVIMCSSSHAVFNI